MTITVDIPKDVEQKIQQNILSGDIEAARHLLFETISPTIEACIVNNTKQPKLSHEEFKARLDKLTNTFSKFVDLNSPPLSDYALSREGIYEEHP